MKNKRRRIETYYVKNSYIPNEINKILDIKFSETYWNKKRIVLSYYYQHNVYQFALELIKKNGINSIIDVGCGVGSKLKLIYDKFPHLNYIGIDQKNAIEYCERNHNFGKWYIDDLENPQLGSAKIKGDLVISSDVIEHLNKPTTLLKYLKSVAKEDGLILISTPERDLLRGKDCFKCPNKYHIREWNAFEFKKYIESNGFKILMHEMVFPIKITFSLKIEYLITFYSEFIKRILYRKPLKYNQLLLLKCS
ncbi:hypothetical protein LCGC14_0965210 [marine sediment metagenome]|uniref:Methyltransferase domain-containing protein n=1 Tax=marine sediment metagenome TaxID=412755 RepID=A0A0F9QWK1_9ZZZZ